MPELRHGEWTWGRPAGLATASAGAWYRALPDLARAAWSGSSMLFGRALAYGVPAGSDARVYRPGDLAWTGDPVPLTAGHAADAPTIGEIRWLEDRQDGLYLLADVYDDGGAIEVLEAAQGPMSLSVGRARTGAGNASAAGRLRHVALVDVGDVPGSLVLAAVVAGTDVFVRGPGAALLHSEGPAAYEPTSPTAPGAEVATRAAGSDVPTGRLETVTFPMTLTTTP